MLKKIERIIFYLLIFSIPIQARVILHKWGVPLAPHLSPPGTGAGFSQWTSAYLYGTDILLGLLFIFWLFRTRLTWKLNFQTLRSSTPKLLRNSYFWLAVFFVISALSIFNSRIVGLSLYQLLKLAEFIGLYCYLKNGLGKIFDFKNILLVVIASGFFQSVIAIAQYLKQGSLGLRLLGESPLSVNTSGVAVFVADSHKYLRAYGTTPHPNILAAWLFVAIFALYFYHLYLNTNSSPSEARRAKEGLLIIIYVAILFAFFFTFSRVIIGLWVLGMISMILFVLFKKDLKKIESQVKPRIVTLTITSLVAVVLFSSFFWPQVRSRIHISAQEEAVSQRVFYNKIAGSVAISHPLLGLGIGQFVPNFMSKFKHLSLIAYQPAHNIYLLIASEVGLVGLAMFLLFIFSVFYNFALRTRFKKLFHYSFFILAGSFLLVGLFDHFLWTLQQGGLIFWMMMALLSVDFGNV